MIGACNASCESRLRERRNVCILTGPGVLKVIDPRRC